MIKMINVIMSLNEQLLNVMVYYHNDLIHKVIFFLKVNLPRALMIAIPMVTILYLLVNISYLIVMTPTEMISSSAVAVTWG